MYLNKYIKFFKYKYSDSILRSTKVYFFLQKQKNIFRYQRKRIQNLKNRNRKIKRTGIKKYIKLFNRAAKFKIKNLKFKYYRLFKFKKTFKKTFFKRFKRHFKRPVIRKRKKHLKFQKIINIYKQKKQKSFLIKKEIMLIFINPLSLKDFLEHFVQDFFVAGVIVVVIIIIGVIYWGDFGGKDKKEKNDPQDPPVPNPDDDKEKKSKYVILLSGIGKILNFITRLSCFFAIFFLMKILFIELKKFLIKKHISPLLCNIILIVTALLLSAVGALICTS